MYGGGGQPIVILQRDAKREHGHETQMMNIAAGRSVAGIVRTTLGPKSMLKLMLDPLGGIVITNDGNAILREIDVRHPAAKSVIELSRAQDEEVGDGTTSVVIIAGEILSRSEELLLQKIHPTLIVRGYFQALEDSLSILEGMATHVKIQGITDGEVSDKGGKAEGAPEVAESESGSNSGSVKPTVTEVIRASMDTKFSSHWAKIVTDLALKAATAVTETLENGKKRIDVRRHARVEKIPGGFSSDCRVVPGILLNKDVTHANMRRLIHNPRIVLLDCSLEYKKGESMTNVEITKEDEFEKLLRQEEEEVEKMCNAIADAGCDIVISEKGISDLAAHFLIKKNITCFRRVKKTDQNRLARLTGATIVNRCEELTANDVGSRCKLFRVEKIADDYWSEFSVEDIKAETTFEAAMAAADKAPGACTVLLRGGTKDSLNEVERNLHDALNVARNILLDPKLLPGGGATEMELSRRLLDKAQHIAGLEQFGYRAVAESLEVIPRTLAQNSGADTVRVLAELRAKHSNRSDEDARFFGVDGKTGQVVNVTHQRIWDTYAVKAQMLKTAIECVSYTRQPLIHTLFETPSHSPSQTPCNLHVLTCLQSAMLMRVDDVLSGIGKGEARKQIGESMAASPDMPSF